MLDLWQQASLWLVDRLFGWSLRLPWDLTLLLLALATSALMVFVRRFTTDQDLLRRAAADGRRLDALIAAAKAADDSDALARLRQTQSMVAMKKMRAEGFPLLVSLLPIAMLATWAFERMPWHPPRAGEPVELTAYVAVAAFGSPAHLLPVEGLTVEEGLVREVVPGTYQGQTCGVAHWRIRGEPRATPYVLTLRVGSETHARPWLVGQTTHSPKIQQTPGSEVVTDWSLRPAKWFGVVPGLGPMLPPWVVAYLLAVVPTALLLKKVTRIE